MATLESVSNKIRNQLLVSSKVDRFIASNLHTIVFDRIFTKGIATDGAPIGTYTATTISIKRSKGQYSGTRVNLRDTNLLANSYQVEVRKADSVLGFTKGTHKDGTTNKQLIAKLEGQEGFNKNIFALTKDEANEIAELTADYFDTIFK